MKADNTRKWTDKELLKIQKELDKIYKQAQGELYSKWDEYMQMAEKRIARYETAYNEALKVGSAEQIEQAKQRLSSAKQWETLRNDYFREMVDDTTLRLANTNQIAMNYINSKTPSIYTKNFNDAAVDAKNLGIKFSMVNENAVKNLVGVITKRTVNVAKDRKWNDKQINSAVLQGIIQGESMPTIAKRIKPLVNNNKNSAIRTARTMVTEAENKGKYDSFRELEEKGLIVEDEWVAVGDSRTRDWHLVMDGQRRNSEGYFIDGLGNKLRYPADPTAPLETIINCRCGLKTVILGFRNSKGNVIPLNYKRDMNKKTLHQMQIRIEKERRKDAENG